MLRVITVPITVVALLVASGPFAAGLTAAGLARAVFGPQTDLNDEPGPPRDLRAPAIIAVPIEVADPATAIQPAAATVSGGEPSFGEATPAVGTPVAPRVAPAGPGGSDPAGATRATSPPVTTTAAPSTRAPEPTVTTTTAAPTTTVAPTTTAEPAGRTLLRAPIATGEAVPFGQSGATIERALTAQFGRIDYEASSNWGNVSLVTDPSGDYIRTRSEIGSNSRQQFNVGFEPAREAYLVYRFMLEPGFDAGDGDGSEGSPVWGTGVKMPGLMRGRPAENTGGAHTRGGFSGRLMIRGTRKSDGRNDRSREGLSLAAYVYGQSIDGRSITSGYGEDYYFLDGFGATPFEGIESGMHEGVGDPRIWDLTEGRWVTVVLGYRVDGEDGWFKAWTKTEGVDAVPQPRLFVPHIDWTGGNEGPDSLLFQQFWGGKGSVWYPDSVSYMRFRDFAVFTSESDALIHAR